MDMTELADKLSRSVQGLQALDNRKRAIRAYEALEVHADQERFEPVEDLLTDLLTNILHLKDETDVDFPQVWQRAVAHYAQEAVRPTPGPREPAEVTYRCPECDTYSGSFTVEEDGQMLHSICGREGSVDSFIRGTQEYEDAYNEDESDPCCDECGEEIELQVDGDNVRWVHVNPTFDTHQPIRCCCDTNPGECEVHEPGLRDS